jgi:hypothetical protein
MNGRYSIRREAEGLSLPFGANGVAAIGALVGGLAGLLMPRAWLETAAFQLYVDVLIPSAKAPLGATAQLVAAVLLAIAGALAGYLVAWVFGVTASPGGFSGLLARLRGELAEDEEDAPQLRAADRHPDAPARRPFSAARDIPDDAGVTIDAVAQPRFDDDDDELLLDLPVAEEEATFAVPERAPLGAAMASTRPTIATTIADEDFEAIDPAAEPPQPRVYMVDAMDGIDLSPPTLDDWEAGAFTSEADVQPEQDAAREPAMLADAETPAQPDPEPVVASAPPRARVMPPPLDLSAARLDDLIARLEAGLTRKMPVAPPAATDEAMADDGDTLVAERPAPPPSAEPEPDPAFPHDPALAAALATLRKMNLRSA